MYKIITLNLLLFGMGSSICAQPSTNYIVNTNITWSGMWTGDGMDPFTRVDSYYIRFKEDTLVDNKVYTKVWQSNDSLATNWQLRGLIKEDNGKVVYRRLDLSEDLLLYDFSLKKGDTVTIRYIEFGNKVKMSVDSVDSVIVFGTQRLRIQLNGYDGLLNETWIEKIGCFEGIFYSCYHSAGGRPFLLCVFEDMNKIYGNPVYPNCYYTEKSINSVVQTPLIEKIAVYPSPFTGIFKVKSSVALKCVELFDVYGKNISKKDYSDDRMEDDFSLPSHMSGFFFLKITTYNNHTTICKIQKLN